MSITRMLSWFPAAWRDRYEAEVRELLEAQPFTWRERRDLLRACADAWAREWWRWALAVGRLGTAIFVRLGVVLAVGWIGVQLVHVLAALSVTRSIAADGGLWVTAASGFRNPMAMMLMLFLARPYAESGSAADRPSLAQTIWATMLFVMLAALDPRGEEWRRVTDMIMLGVLPTMRYSEWFNKVMPWRRVPNRAARIIGMQ